MLDGILRESMRFRHNVQATDVLLVASPVPVSHTRVHRLQLLSQRATSAMEFFIFFILNILG